MSALNKIPRQEARTKKMNQNFLFLSIMEKIPKGMAQIVMALKQLMRNMKKGRKIPDRAITEQT